MKKKMGRPKIVIDFNMVDKLCAIQCTGEEIASVLGVNYDTLNLRIKETYSQSFSDYFKSKSGAGKASLRRTQFELAKKNAAMCIWLGKQYLGQREPEQYLPETEQEAPEFSSMTNEQLDEYILKHKASYA